MTQPPPHSPNSPMPPLRPNVITVTDGVLLAGHNHRLNGRTFPQPSERRPDSPNPFALLGASDPTSSILQPLENLQHQIRTQLRQVFGIGHPPEPPSTLQQIANRFHPLSASTTVAQPVPLLETAHNRPLVLNLPLQQTDMLDNQLRAQITQALNQQPASNQNQTDAMQNLVTQTNQLTTLQTIEFQLRTPLLQALNLSEPEVLNQNQALYNAVNVSLSQSPSPTLSDMVHHGGLIGSFSGSSLILPVEQALLGSKVASTRDDYIFLADCSLRAHRHNELLTHVRAFLSVKENRRDLVKDERYFVAVAYKDFVRNIRDAWRKIRKLEADDKKSIKAKMVVAYRSELEAKMRIVCTEGLLISDKLLEDSIASVETRMYFFKVKGDLYRYMAEYSTGSERTKSASMGKASYEEADYIKTCVSCVHPLRLGLALNFGVFLRDACQDSNRGWRVTKVALDDANRGFQSLAELNSNDYRESNGLLMNLRRNLMRWNTAEVDLEEQNRTLRLPATPFDR